MQRNYRASCLAWLVLLALIVSACAPVPAAPSGSEAAAPAGPVTNSAGVQLPDDAAPLEQQIFHTTTIEGKHFDTTRNLYETNGMQGSVWEPLVWLDAD